MREQKPIHVEKKSSPDMSDQETLALYNVATKIAQAKLDDLMPHFGENVKLQLHSEEDEDEIRFYVGVKVTF